MGKKYNIIIRRVEEEDIVPLSQLYEQVWPGNYDLHLKKTIWAINGSDYNGLLAEENGQVIGSRTCFRTNLFFDKIPTCCVQLGNSCTDADHRRMGLFTKMNQAFLTDFFKTGQELIYNVSVEASRKAYEKLGWTYINSLKSLYYIPNPVSLLFKVKGKIGMFSGNIKADYAPIPSITPLTDELLIKREEFLYKDKLHTKYDKETIKWRLETDSCIRLYHDENLGACIYKLGKKGSLKWIQIGEIFLKNYTQYTFNMLINNIQRIHHPDVIEASITIGHPLFSFYKRKRFIGNPKKPYLNLGVKVLSDKMKNICLNPENWAISLIDIDTF